MEETQSHKDILKGKTVALGVSGGIACYKVVELASRLTRAGATVKTIMTENATKFVTPLTFKTITGQPVITSLFEDNKSENPEISHVSINEEADIFVVAPATANIMAKAAHGLADDALSTVLLAARSSVSSVRPIMPISPIIMAPAMNNHMWLNPATQSNVGVLKERGVYIVGPEEGRLACGEENAIGRLAEIGSIVECIERVLTRASDLKGLNLMVTAGGTREPIDPVRYIGNRSSGKMGYAIAQAALNRGASVILVTGPSCLPAPAGAETIHVETALQMHDAVMGELERVDAVIMAAAVADVRPARTSSEKIRKGAMPESIELELNPDILQAVSLKRDELKSDNKKIIVGFAAESERVIENATEKLKRKGLDMIVANDISAPDVGFDSDRNLAVLIDRGGPIGKLTIYRKTDLADKILDRLKQGLL